MKSEASRPCCASYLPSSSPPPTAPARGAGLGPSELRRRDAPRAARKIPFRLPSLDRLLCGGCPAGEGILQVCGPAGVGKTSLCLQLAVSLAAGCSPALQRPQRSPASCGEGPSDACDGSPGDAAEGCRGRKRGRSAERNPASCADEAVSNGARSEKLTRIPRGRSSISFSLSLSECCTLSRSSSSALAPSSCLLRALPRGGGAPPRAQSREIPQACRRNAKSAGATHGLQELPRETSVADGCASPPGAAPRRCADGCEKEECGGGQQVARRTLRRTRTLFIDSEGGARLERLRQIAASFAGLRLEGEPSPSARVSGGAARREAEGEARRERHAEGMVMSAEVEAKLERLEREELALQQLVGRIDIARIFDHKELLAVLQHVYLLLTREASLEGGADLGKEAEAFDGPEKAEKEAETPGGETPARLPAEATTVAPASRAVHRGRASQGRRPRETYGLIVVDSLSWIFHPAFFHSAAECAALLLQCANVISLLSTRFQVAAVVTSQLTTAKASFAPLEETRSASRAFAAAFPQAFAPSLGRAWRQVPVYSLGLRWPEGASLSSRGGRRALYSGAFRAEAEAGFPAREIVVFKTPTLFNALGEAAAGDVGTGGEDDRSRARGPEDSLASDDAEPRTGALPVAAVKVVVAGGGVREYETTAKGDGKLRFRWH
ncbi:hypothetical protein BESB_028450 [Besnoitia besnoiti]|uniref:RecA family profile 1 domain-containing protein n=1 Tax=Besnoitia besnoiti TaxID=94643 RepID=A0A2A9M7N6_BESBE|nr:uncharacterized protein BESB_028450 [Besnoitia besnoiti]PFH31410.1 hypothetical protein BESB_028450 [Besnoitia besnoiti]